MNSLTIIGNLTRDPELRQVQGRDGTVSVCSFTVAVNRRQRGANGQEEADFFRVSAWRGLAENCQKYLAKGRKVAVRGAVSCRTYTGNDGAAHASLEVSADEVEFLTPRQDAQGTPASAQNPAQNPQPQQTTFTPVYEEDLPF